MRTVAVMIVAFILRIDILRGMLGDKTKAVLTLAWEFEDCL